MNIHGKKGSGGRCVPAAAAAVVVVVPKSVYNHACKEGVEEGGMEVLLREVGNWRPGKE